MIEITLTYLLVLAAIVVTVLVVCLILYVFWCAFVQVYRETYEQKKSKNE